MQPKIFKPLLFLIGLVFVTIVNTGLISPGVLNYKFSARLEAPSTDSLGNVVFIRLYKEPNKAKDSINTRILGKEILLLRTTRFFDQVVFSSLNGRLAEGYLLIGELKDYEDKGFSVRRSLTYRVDVPKRKNGINSGIEYWGKDAPKMLQGMPKMKGFENLKYSAPIEHIYVAPPPPPKKNEFFSDEPPPGGG